MPSYNLAVIMGNVTADIDLKYTTAGKAVCEFTLAINHKYTTQAGEKREEVSFISVTLFGRQAEIAQKYAKKGDPLHVQGRLKQETWDDKQTGQKRSKIVIIGDSIQLISSKRAADDSHQQPKREYSKNPPRQAAPPPQTEEDSFEEDDVPF